MHLEDKIFWERCQKKYEIYFKDPARAVEFGSFNVNGSIRESCECTDYIGVDWREGRDVDIVSLAHEVDFPPEIFDLVMSASMLEHDPHWDKSITKMVEVLKGDAVMIISWGAIKNPPHELKTAPDGKFHPLKAGLVLAHLEELGMYIHEFGYDRSITESILENPPEKFRYFGEAWGKTKLKTFAKARLKDATYGLGEAFIVAFKDKKYALGEQVIEPLQEWDKV